MATTYAARIAQFYRRLASLKQDFAADLEETLLPTAEFNYALDPANFRLRGDDLFIGTRIQTAVAAATSDIILQAAPNTIAVIEQVQLNDVIAFTVTQYQMNWEFGVYTPSNAQQVNQADGRAQNPTGLGSPSHRGLLMTPTTTPGGGALVDPFVNMLASNLNWFPLRLVLFGGFFGPGQTASSWRVRVRNLTQNQDLIVSVQGYERLLEPTETF